MARNTTKDGMMRKNEKREGGVLLEKKGDFWQPVAPKRMLADSMAQLHAMAAKAKKEGKK